MSIPYILACVAVPITWGAVVHYLFASWHERQAARQAAAVTVHDEEAEEPNVP
jgi:hypothetical protein